MNSVLSFIPGMWTDLSLSEKHVCLIWVEFVVKKKKKVPGAPSSGNVCNCWYLPDIFLMTDKKPKWYNWCTINLKTIVKNPDQKKGKLGVAVMTTWLIMNSLPGVSFSQDRDSDRQQLFSRIKLTILLKWTEFLAARSLKVRRLTSPTALEL